MNERRGPGIIDRLHDRKDAIIKGVKNVGAVAVTGGVLFGGIHLASEGLDRSAEESARELRVAQTELNGKIDGTFEPVFDKGFDTVDTLRRTDPGNVLVFGGQSSPSMQGEVVKPDGSRVSIEVRFPAGTLPADFTRDTMDGLVVTTKEANGDSTSSYIDRGPQGNWKGGSTIKSGYLRDPIMFHVTEMGHYLGTYSPTLEEQASVAVHSAEQIAGFVKEDLAEGGEA